ncbi:polysaccharide deacetylase family protein [Pseudochryseolinea flava]|uniref:NodB homology domain-containing protein n=1 Tax=Pseudochryseolinea flava TaxID=2059302 RepID=A0A364Y279_9BACT|nr:polysaccharide deacetylase family protein [Pseudochryseolinea flava]RAW00383.1 hypothetical protein DQQ10_15130 [Pseudochryseolinea flava]
MKIQLFIILTLLIVSSAFAGGPRKVAKSNRSLWPYAINSPSEFDFASKMEMLVFARVLDEYEHITIEDSIRSKLGVQKIDVESMKAWRENMKKILLANFSVLRQTTPHDFMKMSAPRGWADVIAASMKVKENIPTNLRPWFANACDFYDGYIYEQLRLAALFPRITSEILTLSNTEIIGSEYSDKQFLLTFDDGPTVVGGNTDKLLATLGQHGVNGLFFVLGDMLAARVKKTSIEKTRAFFGAMALGSHGKVHQPHPRYEQWEQSLAFTDQLLDSVIGNNSLQKYFRPPYGQRNDKMVAFLKTRQTQVMLWNIDSQDWNATITAKEVADRVTTLMLLWRRGIILFHDIHPKANAALPTIWNGFKDAGIHWIDAKKI